MASDASGSSPGLNANGPGLFVLQLGSVFFWTNECPDMLPIGAVSQMQTTHQLIGGGRIVQTFGPDAADVAWTGRFFSDNIEQRIQQLRLYTVNATEVFVSWKNEQYLAIVKNFEPHYHGGYAEYNIELVITRDQNGAFTLASPLSIDTQISNLFVQASDLNDALLNADPQVTAVLNDDPQIPASTPAAAAATATASPSTKALAGYQKAFNTLQQVIAVAGPIAANITTAGPAIVSAANAAAAGIQAYQDTLGGLDPNLVNAVQLGASVASIAANAQRGQTVQQTIQQGVSLFQVATQQYGDIGLGYTLSAANDIISPFLSASTSTRVSTPPFTEKAAA